MAAAQSRLSPTLEENRLRRKDNQMLVLKAQLVWLRWLRKSLRRKSKVKCGVKNRGLSIWQGIRMHNFAHRMCYIQITFISTSVTEEESYSVELAEIELSVSLP